jgi:hypothetical protein
MNQFKILSWNDEAKMTDGTHALPLYDFLLPKVKEELEIESRERRLQELNLVKNSETTNSSTNHETENATAASTKFKTTEILDRPSDQTNPAAFYDALDFDKYRMERNPHGKCLLINIETFKRNQSVDRHALSTRNGAAKDAESLRNLFTNLQFEVDEHTNIDLETLLKLLRTYSVMDHSGFDAFICCIMTHGNLGLIYASDGQQMPVLDITDYFSARRCPTLAGKPKLFFIQACQKGDRTDDPPEGSRMQTDEQSSSVPGLVTDAVPDIQMAGLEIRDIQAISHEVTPPNGRSNVTGNTSAASANIQPIATELVHDADMENAGVSSQRATNQQRPLPSRGSSPSFPSDSLPVPVRAVLVPGEPDFLMSYSTLPGSVSYRDPIHGSLYVNALCKYLRQSFEIDRALKLVVKGVKDTLTEQRTLHNIPYDEQYPLHFGTGMSKLLYLLPQSQPTAADGGEGNRP